jgi:cytochrome oxidase assembly protein ShyY1
LLVILFSLSVGLLTILGFWQLDRADQKRQRYENFLERHQSSELRLEKSSTLADLKWRKAVLIGNYEDINLLLDNRVYMKQSGYEVVTPFIFDDGNAVLVNRGWVSNRGSRDFVPSVSVQPQRLEIKGYFGPPPVVGIRFFGKDKADFREKLGDGTIRVQKIDPSSLGYVSKGKKLMKEVFYLEDAQSGALRVDRKLPGSGSEKHEAYATQWFSMAAILAFIGLWNLLRKK